MSGHSKWATTKRAKAVVDAKRGALFTRLANTITIAAREKGGDPETNFSLRLAIEKARAGNMPRENIDRAIKRGTGELAGVTLEEIIYEGFGPGGVAVMVFTLTDNRNRTVSDLKHAFSKQGGNLGSAGSVSWMFEKKGTLGIPGTYLTDELELALIEGRAQDIVREGDEITIVTLPEDLQRAKALLEAAGITPVFAEFEYRARTTTDPDPESLAKIEKLFEAIEEIQDVTDYTSNLA